MGINNKFQVYDIVPIKEIKSLIPGILYKKKEDKAWGDKILQKWKEFSNQLETAEEGYKTFISMLAEKEYYGGNFFWVENYKYNKQGWLSKNMWLVVKYDRVIFVNEDMTTTIKEFHLQNIDVNHYPNAIILYPEGEEPFRLTTATVYPLIDLIRYYKKTLKEDSFSRASFEDFEEEKRDNKE